MSVISTGEMVADLAVFRHQVRTLIGKHPELELKHLVAIIEVERVNLELDYQLVDELRPDNICR